MGRASPLRKDTASRTTEAQRGYLYYKLNEKKPEVCRKEWADLKSVAGTGQIVGFGSRFEEKGSLRQTDAKPEKPDTYPLGFGMTRVAKRDYKPINESAGAAQFQERGRAAKKVQERITSQTSSTFWSRTAMLVSLN